MAFEWEERCFTAKYNPGACGKLQIASPQFFPNPRSRAFAKKTLLSQKIKMLARTTL